MLQLGVGCRDDDLSPSWESLEGLCTKYVGLFGDLEGDDGARLVMSDSDFVCIIFGGKQGS